MKTHVIACPSVAQAALAALAGQRVGLDIETTGLDPLTNRARLLQVASEDKLLVIDLDQAGGLGAFCDKLLRLKPVCHNALFEMAFMRRAGVPLTPDCTMLAHHAMAGQAESLEGLADRHLGLQLDKSFQKSDWAGELSREQIEYAATDARVALRLWHLLEPALEEQQLGFLYRLQVNAQPAVTEMRLRGMPFNGAQHKALIERLEKHYVQLTGQVASALGRRNPRSGEQVAGWLGETLSAAVLRQWSKTPGGVLSTRRDTFARMLEQLPPGVATTVTRLLDHKLVAKQLSAFGPNLLRKVHPATGRIHADFHLAGPVTGRMSCSNPNLQQIPRGPDFRVLFQAPPGRRLVVADYSQVELRVAAMIAGEAGLLAAYRAGRDVHAITAAILLNKRPEDVTKHERQLAKAANFGLLYGQGASGLRNYAASNYGVKISLREASQHRAAWRAAYPAFPRWHDTSGFLAQQTLMAETPAGRWRRWRKDQFRTTESYNTPVQGGAAEAMLAGLSELTRE
ncbi:MAG: hypothetical protein JOZ93_12150, partial [Sinobacteraceae bacterium]|nr:hypothetical protein [Nevskiaceae bacterium]